MIKKIDTGSPHLDEVFGAILAKVPIEIDVWIESGDEEDYRRRPDVIDGWMRLQFKAHRMTTRCVLTDSDNAVRRFILQMFTALFLDLQIQAYEWLRDQQISAESLPRLPWQIFDPAPSDEDVGDPATVTAYFAQFKGFLFGEHGPFKDDKKALAVLDMAYEQVWQAMEASRYGQWQYPVPQIFRVTLEHDKELREERQSRL